MQKDLGKIIRGLDCSGLSEGPRGEAIEKILHKYELEIRAHIKMENELKQIMQETEERYTKMKVEYNTISGKYNDVIHKLSSFIYENENLARENNQLKKLFSDIVVSNGGALKNTAMIKKKGKESRKRKRTFQSTDKKKSIHHYNPSNYIKLSVSKKKVV